MRKLIITDVKKESQLKEQIAVVRRVAHLAGRRAAKIVWHLGGHNMQDFTRTELVVRNPDVPYYLEFLRVARKAGVKIENDITLFLKMHGLEETLAVTGTRGKTTTTRLLYEMVRAHNKSAFVAGNVGFSPLLEPSWSDPARPAVFELSSFMLHEFGEQKISPHISVVTNIFPDHLNKYKGMDDYMADKQNIYLHQKPGEFVVLNTGSKVVHEWGLNERIRREKKWGRLAQDSVKFFSLKDLKPFANDLKFWKLPGKHNLENLAAAVVAARAYGIHDACIKKVIRNFKGVPYRLELVREVRMGSGKVCWYNDSTATSPEGAMAALDSFSAKKIILISGGNSKGLDLSGLSKAIKKKVRVLILNPGNATKNLPKSIFGGSVYYIEGALENPGKTGALYRSIALAHSLAEAGDVVLFSPGLTWLPSINEFARGDLFKKLVKKIV